MIHKNIFRTACLTATATLALSAISSATVLFTTVEDFAQFPAATDSLNPNGTIATQTTDYTLTPQVTPDFDGSATNGVGNNSSPGGSGTAGSLFVNTGTTGTYDAYTIDVLNNAAFLSAFGSSTSITLNLTNPTTPTNTEANYFQLFFLVNYNGGFIALEPTSLIDSGLGYNIATYDNSAIAADLVNRQATPGALTYFQVGFVNNTNFYNSTLTVDNVQAIPEPSTVAMAAVSLVGGALMLRKRRAAEAK